MKRQDSADASSADITDGTALAILLEHFVISFPVVLLSAAYGKGRTVYLYYGTV